jgi:RimJ/RimL family protein N-acetyltransferase
VRLTEGGKAVGTVQATIGARGGLFVADLAWVIAPRHQRRGYATEAAMTVAAWLRARGADALAANIHPDHHASSGVARALGLAPTGEVVDGEVRWVGPAGGGPG